MKQKKAYTTDSVTTVQLLNRLFQKIERTTHQDPHPWLIIASHQFGEPHPLVNEINLLSLSAMDLLMQYAYPSILGYSKFTISLTVQVSYGEVITFTLGEAIPLTEAENGNLINLNVIYSNIYSLLSRYSEIYDGSSIVKVMIRAYLSEKKKVASIAGKGVNRV